MDNNFNNQDNLNKQEQTDYYNNDSYYSNNNYDNNYSDTTYEEKEKKNGIWWKILLAVLILLIIILLLLKFCSGDGKSKDEKYTELTNRICKAAETYVMNNPNLLDRTEPGKSAIIKFKALADANLIEAQIENPYYSGGLFSNSKEDKYYSLDASVRLTVLGDGTLNCEMVDNSKDVTPPDLRLNGDTTITLAVGTDFEDPGYTATDDYDGDITDKVVVSGTAPNDKAGEYELTYTVSDSAGNTTTKKRKIIYEEFGDLDITLGSVLDGVTPMITLKGSNPYCMVKGTKYVEPGAVATDNVDGNISDKIVVTNNVTGNLMGAFRVIYKVEDSSGNEAIAYRAVIVTTECPEEKPETAINNAPTISLIGKTAVTVSRGTQYIDLGATAYDKEDGDLTSKIVTDTSAVNTNQDGIYKVIYRVTDSGGKTSTATRTVTVKSSTASNPVVRFTEDKNNIEVVVGEGNDNLLTPPKAVNENGVQVAVTTKIEDYTTKEVLSKIDWTAVGKYRVIYTAIHGNGSLKQTKSIVVTVIEDTAQIGGKDAINVPVRTENCNINEADLIKGGVTFTSKSNQTPIVTVDDKEGKACKIGTYEVNVTAKVGEKETTKKITVYVVNGEGEDGVKDAPSKVTITGNTANPTNVYNTNGVWVGGDVTGITLLFSSTPAANTEIAHFEVSTNCSDVSEKVAKLTPTLGTLSWTKEGKSSVCIRAVTTTGIAGPWSNPVNLYIDRTGPSVQFTHDWVDDENSWYNTPSLTLTYSATDSESGLSHFEYTYDDVKAKKAEDIVTYNEATGSLTVNENTEPTRSKLFVYVRAVDKAGNKGEWTTNPAYANIDTVKPNAPTLSVSGDSTNIVKITANFTDGQSVRPSGFGKLIYKLNDGEDNDELTQTITMPVNNTKEDIKYNVKVWAVDKAGNKSDLSAETNVTVKPNVVSVNAIEKIKDLYNKDPNGNGLIKDDTKDQNIRYAGSNNTVKNYVKFNGELWRIIGIFNVSNGAVSQERIKLIRDAALIQSASWDSSASNINSGSGIDEWSQADLKSMLNDYYYGSKAECLYCNSVGQSTCTNSCNSFVKKMSEEAKEMIDSVVWHLGGLQYGGSDGSEITTASEAYNLERGGRGSTASCGTSPHCTATDNVGRTSTWIGYIGLIYGSDYAYASTEQSCRRDATYNYGCGNNNWLNDNTKYWSITHRESSYYKDAIWRPNQSVLADDIAGAPNAVRPSVYLDPTVEIAEGTGTSSDPFILVTK